MSDTDMDCSLGDAEKLSTESVEAMVEVCLALWDDMECERIDGGRYSDGQSALIRAVQHHPDLNLEITRRQRGMNGRSPADRFPARRDHLYEPLDLSHAWAFVGGIEARCRRCGVWGDMETSRRQCPS